MQIGNQCNIKIFLSWAAAAPPRRHFARDTKKNNKMVGNNKIIYEYNTHANKKGKPLIIPVINGLPGGGGGKKEGGVSVFGGVMVRKIFSKKMCLILIYSDLWCIMCAMTMKQQSAGRRQGTMSSCGGKVDGVITPADILADNNIASFVANNPISCKAVPSAREAPAFWLFGGEKERASFRRNEIPNMMAQVEGEFRHAKDGIELPPATLRAMKKDEALLDFALMTALDARPYRQFMNGRAANVYYKGDAAFRVRKISRSGDIWIDRRDEKGKWDFRFFRKNAWATLCELHPLLSGLTPQQPSDFKRIMLFFLLLANAMGRNHKQRGGKNKKIYGRRAFLSLAAKHPAFRRQTRVMLAVMSVAGGGDNISVSDIFVQKVLRVAGLDDKNTRLARRTIGLFRSELWDFLRSGGFRWRDFLRWNSVVIGKLNDNKAAHEFRGVWRLWQFCLSRNGGKWRWRGWHTIPLGGCRKDAGGDKRLATAANISKATASRIMSIGQISGLWLRDGICLCLAIGIWGKALQQRAFSLRDTARSFNWLLPVIDRCLSPPPQSTI